MSPRLRLVALLLAASACEQVDTPGRAAGSDEEAIGRLVQRSLAPGAVPLAPVGSVGDPNALGLAVTRIEGGYVAQMTGSASQLVLVKDDGSVLPFGVLRRATEGQPLLPARVIRTGRRAIVLDCNGADSAGYEVSAVTGEINPTLVGGCGPLLTGRGVGAGASDDHFVIASREANDTLVVRAYRRSGTTLVAGETLLSRPAAPGVPFPQPDFVEETSPGVIEVVGRVPGPPGGYDLGYFKTGGAEAVLAGTNLPLQLFDNLGQRETVRWLGPGSLRIHFEQSGAGSYYGWDVGTGGAFGLLAEARAEASFKVSSFGFGEAVESLSMDHPDFPGDTSLPIPTAFFARGPSGNGYTRRDVATTPCTSRAACRALGETRLLGVVGLGTTPVALYRLWAWAGQSQRVIGLYATPLRPASDDAGGGVPVGAGGGGTSAVGGAGGAGLGASGGAGGGSGAGVLGGSGGNAGQDAGGASGGEGGAAGAGGEEAGGDSGGAGAAGAPSACESGALFSETRIDIVSSTGYPVISSMIAADLNHDGYRDLVVNFGDTPASSALLLGAGGVSFAPSTYVSFGENFNMAVGDVNGDGTDDVVGQGDLLAQTSKLSWYLGASGAADGGSLTVDVSALKGRQRGIVAADFDADGLADAAFLHEYGAKLAIVRSEPKFKFTVLTDIAIEGGLIAALAASDLNQDGKPDLLGVDATGRIQVFLAPFVAPPIVGSVGAAAGEHVVGRFDADLFPDVAIANPAGKSVTVHKGDGKGSFGPAVAIPVPHAPARLALGDTDGDGFLDLVSVDGVSTLVILHGKGDGTFGEPVVVTPTYPPSVLLLDDLDADGRAEIICAWIPPPPQGAKWLSILKRCP